MTVCPICQKKRHVHVYLLNGKTMRLCDECGKKMIGAERKNGDENLQRR
jgi:Zn ribbon nucleic-acid-binding protein